MPTTDRRTSLPHAKALGVLLRSLLVEREPIYRQEESVRAFAADAFGLAPGAPVGDDRIGRALDRLFDADRGTLLTELVVAMGKAFDITFTQFHSDTTTVRFTGQYGAATGRSLRGRKAPWITCGYSKDHRPDLKQLLLVLATSSSDGLPVHFRCEAGNASDSRTHEATWDALCRVAGGPDFLYVADSKLCGGQAMDYIDRRRGRFVTVLPRSRREDERFRHWVQEHEVAWETVRERPHPRRRGGPRDTWRVWRSDLPSREGWPVVWVHSNLLALKQAARREENLARAKQDLAKLVRYVRTHRPRAAHRLRARVDRILERRRVARYLVVKVAQKPEHEFRQERAGRPGPDTRYRRVTRKRWEITWHVDEAKKTYDRKSDGMYPLLTNDPTLTPGQVLLAHKGQPAIERRFQALKSVQRIAPVFLKNEGRIEALFFLYAVALLVQGLLEREIRAGMDREGMKDIALYPEERRCRRPTAEQVMRLFASVARYAIERPSGRRETFPAELSDVQRQVLDLAGVPLSRYIPR